METTIAAGALLQAGGAIAIISRSNEVAAADASGFAIGGLLLGLGKTTAKSIVDGTSKAVLNGAITDPNGESAGATNLTVLAQHTGDADSDASASGGGLIGIDGALAEAFVGDPEPIAGQAAIEAFRFVVLSSAQAPRMNAHRRSIAKGWRLRSTSPCLRSALCVRSASTRGRSLHRSKG